MLMHVTVLMTCDPARYIPFRGEVPGTKRGEHTLRLGCEAKTVEEGIAHAKEWALDVFPEATIVEAYETNILGERKEPPCIGT